MAVFAAASGRDFLPILPHKEVTKVKRGKKYSEAAKLVDSTMLYDAADAIDLVQKTSTTKFDATVEADINR
mgnify:FL=1